MRWSKTNSVGLRKFGVVVTRTLATTCSAIAIGCVSAHAQGADASAAASQPVPAGEQQLEEIIVRGTKSARAETAQRVSLAVTALSARTIENLQAVNVIDVARVAPNVAFSQASTLPGFANFFIRGQGVANSTSSADPAVNVVVDGMVYDFQGGTVLDSFDLEGIEILRGPQGILFGRNTTGGAVSLRTARPTDKLEAKFETTVGNYDRFDISGMVSGPIVGDTVLGKISVLHRQRDGILKDNNGGTFVPAPLNPSGLAPSSVDRALGKSETWVVRPTIVFKPAAGLDISLLGEYAHITGDGPPSQLVQGVDPNSAVGAPYWARLTSVFGYTPPTGKFETNLSYAGFTDIAAARLVGELNWNVGAGIITSVTGYRDVDYKFSFDADGTPFNLLQFPEGNNIRSKQFSQEIRFASDFSDVINFVVGGYFDQHKLHLVELRTQSSALVSATPPETTVYQRGEYHQTTRSYALFGNINVHVTPRLTLTAGGRYTKDKKHLSINPILRCTGPGFVGCQNTFTDFNNEWNNFSPKAGAEYHFTDQIMAYASYTRGFRSGNYNGRAASGNSFPITPAVLAAALSQVGPANPEKVDSYEVGLKSTFLGGRARVNIALFDSSYKDIQLSVRQGLLQVFSNAASATIRGAEIEATLRPFDGFELTGSGGYTDAKYDSFITPITGLTIEQSLTRKLVKVPKYTANVGASYGFRLGDGELTARGSYAWRSGVYVDVVNTPAAFQEGFGLVDASLTYELENWRLAVFGKNLTNKHYFDQENVIFVAASYGAEPRTYGVTLSHAF